MTNALVVCLQPARQRCFGGPRATLLTGAYRATSTRRSSKRLSHPRRPTSRRAQCRRQRFRSCNRCVPPEFSVCRGDVPSLAILPAPGQASSRSLTPMASASQCEDGARWCSRVSLCKTGRRREGRRPGPAEKREQRGFKIARSKG